jgi:hypothetical protein
MLRQLTIKNRNLLPSNNNVLQSGDGDRDKKIDEWGLKIRPLLCSVTNIIKFDSWWKIYKLLFAWEHLML